MDENTKEVLDTEVTEGNEEELDTDEDLTAGEQEEEEDEDPRDLKIKELEEKNQKLYQKLKSGYKKNKEAKEATKENFVSKDDIKNLIMETQKELKAESDFVSTYEDAKDFMPDIKKVMTEKSLTIEEAYALVKGKMLFDEGYKNQMMQNRTGNHGTIQKNTVGSYRHIFEGKKS